MEWLGEVPEHWETPPLYMRYDAVLGKMLDEKRITGQHPTPYIRNVDLQWDSVNIADLPELDITPNELDRFTLKRGDLVICEGGEVGRTAIWSGELDRCAFQKAIHRLRPLTRCESSRYFFYCMRFAAGKEVFLAESNPNTIPHLTGEKLRRYRFPTPPLDEQTAIAAFLDRETSKIDALVSEQRRLIELLKEKRQAVISHAVTKGLDPNAPMKPSGIDWLGNVPEHWQCAMLTRIASRIVVGIAEAATHAYVDDGIPILRSTNIRAGRIIGDILHVDSGFAGDRESKQIQARDLVTVRTGNAGVTAVIPAELDGCQCFTMLITTLEEGYRSEFYCYWMNSLSAQCYFTLEGWGTAQVNISVPILKALPVPMPPVKEQEEIVSYLDRELGRFDTLTAEAERAIELLQERRSALISAAVTGKIDVRGI